jgi:hypothetical protein
VFRDELVEGGTRRLIGPLRSIVVFDSTDPDATDGRGALALSAAWKKKLTELSNFTVADEEINAHRFCTYLPSGDEKGCGKCLAFCPSRALVNSSPNMEGAYPKPVRDQEHRFWDGALQFDNGSCCDDRGQLKTLYDEWMCARCVAICAADGNRRTAAVRGWEEYRTT